MHVEPLLAPEGVHQINLVSDLRDEAEPEHLRIVVGEAMTERRQVTESGQIAPTVDALRIAPGTTRVRTEKPATYEAREFGVHSGMGLMKAAQKAPDAVLLPANFEAYRDFSRRFKAAVAGIAPVIEDRGIDEIYIDLTDFTEDSVSLARRIKAAVLPNIVQPDKERGNPVTEGEVRCAPDGSIVGRRVTKPSGNPAWDETVLRAIDKTRQLPLDGGRIPPTMTLVFSQNETR